MDKQTDLQDTDLREHEQRFHNMLRTVLSVSKKDIDARLAEEKAEKAKQKEAAKAK